MDTPPRDRLGDADPMTCLFGEPSDCSCIGGRDNGRTLEVRLSESIAFARYGDGTPDLVARPPYGYLRLLLACTEIVPVRSCLISFTDSEGIEHSILVPAESLFEAAIEAMAAFRQSVLAEMPLAPGLD